MPQFRIYQENMVILKPWQGASHQKARTTKSQEYYRDSDLGNWFFIWFNPWFVPFREEPCRTLGTIATILMTCKVGILYTPHSSVQAMIIKPGAPELPPLY